MERVWNESRPNRRLDASATSFTAIYGAVLDIEYQIGWNPEFRRAAMTSKVLTSCTITIPHRVKACGPVDNGEAASQSAGYPPKGDHSVFAGRGGGVPETNSVACSSPVPSGVGIEKRKGTSTRVPEIGASQTSASRSVTRYLMAGRSGT